MGLSGWWSLPRKIWLLWHRDFNDFRVILEQHGELKYYSVPARWQRLLSRLAIAISVSALLLVVGLTALAVSLQVSKARLKQSHQEIYLALLGTPKELGASDDSQPALAQADMVLLAQSIRDRNMAIQRYVASATGQMQLENVSLERRLDSTGLTERAIKMIQAGTATGGATRDALGDNVQSLLNPVFLDKSSANRALKDVLNALPTQYPVADHVVTSGFGIRTHPLHGAERFHSGIDLISRGNDAVYAAKSGTVVLARPYNDYGNTVIVRHERGVETLYAHLSSIAVKEGQQVDLSTSLGMMGSTGSSTGKHLHFEISVGGYPVDPLKVIDTAQYVQQAKK